MNKFNLSIDTGITENNEEFVLGKPPKFLNTNTGTKSTNENSSNGEEFVLRKPPKFLSINTGANDNNSDDYIPYDPLAARKQKKKENQKALNNFNKKLLKSKTCPSFKKEDILGIGGFGITAIVNGKVAKIISNFLKQYIIEVTPWKWEWIFDRYKNFCQDMDRYSGETMALFPNNFVKIKQNECGFCRDEKSEIISLYSNMELIKGAIDGDFRENLEKNNLSQEELNKLFAQVYYISIVTNKNSLHHNDLKPANIMIKRASKNIIYNNLVSNGKVLKLKIPKGDYVPVFIDYDLVSFRRFDPFSEAAGFPASGSTSDDFSYFSKKTKEYDSKQKTNKILKLEEVATEFNIEETNKVFSELLPNGYVELSDFIGGKRKKSKKKVKKVRKHQGINQSTGRLNKGYKYSGKLKSGLSKIVKVRKIKQRRK